MHNAAVIEPRPMAETKAQHVPEETVVEVQTVTKTVLEDCAPTRTNSAVVTTGVLEDTTSAQTKPEPAPPQSQTTDPAPTHFETNYQTQSTTPEPTTTILMTTTTTVTDSATGAVSVSASVSITAPTTKTDHAPQILPILDGLPGDLPGLLPGIATAIPVPNLPLDQALHPNGAALPPSLQWTTIPADGAFTSEGFGKHSAPQGTRIKYHGNVGIPWGSNIISVSPTQAHRYKYVAQFRGSNTEPWTVVLWNKVGPDGKMDGWYGHSALRFVLAPGETRYVAFDEDSVGAWGAAPGTDGLPTDDWGGYTSTWGEFSFGDVENGGWSGWDVSAIQAQIAHQTVQGMRICKADGLGCSIITPQAREVVAAYTESMRHHDGIGGAAGPGPVRLVVDIDYQG